MSTAIDKTKLKVVVVGGGPAGAATAMSLAQQGHQVDLYEAYPPPRKIQNNSPKAYVIALGKRGQVGLQHATGIAAEDVEGGILSRNFVRHNAAKKTSSVITRDPPGLIAPRQALTQHILDQAAKAGVTIHYEQRLVDIDLDQRVVKVEDTKSNKQQDVSYNLLVGADGSKSQTRNVLDEKLEDFQVRSEVDSMEYQVAVLPKSPFPDAPKDASHSWNNKEYNSICLAFPLVSGGMLFAAVFPKGKLKEFQQSGYEDALAALFPDLEQRTIDELVEQLKIGEPANGGLCVWLSCLGSVEKGVALVGDSGHGMWPSLGQGANCALESAAVFCQTCRDLGSSSGNSTPNEVANSIVEEFNRRRYKDAIAAVDLTYGGIGARESRGRQNSPLSYKLQIMGTMLLHKVTFGAVPKPALLRLMGSDGHTLSYSAAWASNFYYEKAICISAVLAIVGVPAAMVLFKNR